ncbi:MAG TPA: stage II sporulation protein P, partial [Limnochordales bacterium]
AGGPAGLALVVALSAAAGGAAATDERTDGTYFRLVDPARRVLTMTARVLVPGDVYIDRDNRRWVVQAVRGYEVLMRPSGTDGTDGHGLQAPAAPLVAGAGQRPGGTVAIYFTHNDESYVPTSGKPWKPRGDVLQVGEALAAALRRQGVDATVSRRSHTPHDGQAYLRSRRTAVQLVRLRPAMLVDVHRDAVPPQVYATRLKGRPAVRVRLVVGRQNPQMAANLEFARRVKAVADRELPGSIEGIFLAHGNYNQDLHPRALLLEFGAHSNSLPQAEATADLFAGVLARAAGIGPAGPAAGAGAARQLGAAAWRAVLALVVGAGGAALAYVGVNRPDLVRRWLRRLSRFTDPLQGR